MCGILFTLSTEKIQNPWSDALIDRIKARGPDHFQIASRTLTRKNQQDLYLYFGASVLALRGNQVVEQPLQDHATASLLCWNGEAWSIGSQQISNENDAEVLFRSLQSCQSASAVQAVLASIVGPFAFVYFHGPCQRLYYGRDVLGRRSLLSRKESTRSITLSSVGAGSDAEWEEIDVAGIFELDLVNHGFPAHALDTANPSMKFVSWDSLREGFPSINRELRPESSSVLHSQPEVVLSLHELLQKSIRTRLTNLLDCSSGQKKSPTLTLAVLFSGGLDSTLLARIIHDHLPPCQSIDLLNVAFENPRLRTGRSEDFSGPLSLYERCPDRVTGRASYRELIQTCPGRKWSFISINIPYVETVAHRARVIELMHPHNTEMDLSIALALYFAARGYGLIEHEHQVKNIESSARVLISGLGADELFGGYGRHLVAYKTRGESGLADELESDFRHIYQRNMGRDDRIMSNWGKEVRYPFLDEELASWALQQPVSRKCDFFAVSNGPVENANLDAAKGVLRSLAQDLGMRQVAVEKKRAIQFGARTAKMQGTKVKGTDKIKPQPA